MDMGVDKARHEDVPARVDHLVMALDLTDEVTDLAACVGLQTDRHRRA